MIPGEELFFFNNSCITCAEKFGIFMRKYESGNYGHFEPAWIWPPVHDFRVFEHFGCVSAKTYGRFG